MSKSPLERQLEKQSKLLEKQQKESKRFAEKEAIRQRAASVVNGQTIIEGMRILDATAEDMLESLLKLERSENNQVKYTRESFPEYIGFGLSIELEKLSQYGMITSLIAWMGGGTLNLLPPALTYFNDKECALKMNYEIKDRTKLHIENLHAHGANIVFGDVVNSTLSIDNSISRIEMEIEEKAGEDKEALTLILGEVKELIENIENSRAIPRQKGLFQKISDHAAKHGWFYAEIVGLFGVTAMKLLGA